MNIRQRNALNEYHRDWHSSEQRMAGNTKPHNPHADARMTYIELLQGVVCVALVMVLLYLVWQVSTPAGIAEIENLARYIWEAV